MWMTRVTKIQKKRGICSLSLTHTQMITLKEKWLVNEVMIQGLYFSDFQQEQKKKK